MNSLKLIPFLRLLVPFLGGIVMSVCLERDYSLIPGILILFAVVTAFIFVKPLSSSYAYSWMFGALITLLLFLAGMQLAVLHTEKLKSSHFSLSVHDADLCYVITDASPVEKEQSYKVTAEVRAIRKQGRWNETCGKLICYLRKDSLSQRLRYGDGVLMKASVEEVPPPANPSEFNYKQYLSYRGIYHQAYLRPGNWKLLSRDQGNPVIAAALTLRERLLDLYRENHISGDEFAVAAALVLGYTDRLDPGLLGAYAQSGTLHVLSVSGLHVGIIYMICQLILTFLDKIPFGKMIRVLLVLLILWSYALLTGLSPAVLRTAVMFSFVSIAQAWKFHSNIFNTLAVSCFVLLLSNPFLVMDVGFQLSFLAVLGIVTIYPWLYEKWQPDGWLPDQIWKLTAVSVSAQAATFPLGLFYFHQFPNYFILSNLLIIPLSGLVLMSGLLVLAVAKIAWVGPLCAKGFSWLILFMNRSAAWLGKLPGAVTQGISISWPEALLLYLLMAFLLAFIFEKRIRYLFFFLTCILLLLLVQVGVAYRARNQRLFIVYDVAGTAAYDFISGTHSVLLGDSALAAVPGKVALHIQPNWRERNITGQKTLTFTGAGSYSDCELCVRNGFIRFAKKQLVVVRDLPRVELPVKFKADALILSENPKLKIADLKKYFDFNRVIVDSSNSKWKADKWKKECAGLRIPFYSVQESGAYIEES